MKLTVFQDDVNLTLKMDDFNNPSKSLDLTDGEIYVGYHKPLRAIYVEMVSRLATDSLVVEYYNGTEFTDVPLFEDKTFGLTQSGFIFLDIDDLEQEETTVGGKELYWLKITTETPATVSVNGINLVLSDDKDFGFLPGIDNYLPEHSTSFIGFHQEARNRIVQYIRNSGKVIRRYETLTTKLIDVFDLLNIEEFRQASKYLALHLIFDYLKKSADDQYAIRSKENYEQYEASLNPMLMSIDTNDNGTAEDCENNVIQFVRIRRE
jgi:hypothetical protein